MFKRRVKGNTGQTRVDAYRAFGLYTARTIDTQVQAMAPHVGARIQEAIESGHFDRIGVQVWLKPDPEREPKS